MRSSTRLLLVPVLLAAAIGLAGCSLPGIGGDSSSKSDSSSKDDASPAADDSAKGGCPASITAALKQNTTMDASEGTVADLAFPGDAALLADACVLVVKATTAGQGDTVMAFVPGDADKAAQITAAVEAAGFTSLTADEKGGFYTKDKESWIIAKGDTSNPLAAGFGDKFSGPIVTLMHIVTA
ncbi:hypothetical protein GCM10027515_32200 [Schumannella luteola]|uniref:Lipoprotein n=1 Tax=Schumannella luteola TaxID=472059 RepID=A0A852YCC0_9MICO|nr:hypothetical protein [Schumannella luteola]NYG98980.1 hypothetical protein [Schumannella luteola]TPX06346.1 hypothetical protein FJ656_01540 [Schumannella luteola]